ncbi:MAG: 23S rRNA (pseudouridine(1915)-N(3))-methyltransferase RlmH [Steroidobacteraceae bacterium]
MRVRLIAVGTRPPSWVSQGYEDYARRLGPRLKLTLVAIEPGRRAAHQDPRRAVEAEGRKILSTVHPGEFVVALDEHGTAMDTQGFSDWLAARMQAGRDLAFLVGGPDGFAPEVRARADLLLSLSRLTLPHALVRVVLAEQLYRALSILAHHPYHRA